MGEKRKHIGPEVKVKILQELLINRVPISELSVKYEIPPSSIYQWQSILFSTAPKLFQRKNDPSIKASITRRYEVEIENLNAKLETKNEVVSEIMEEMVKLKKTSGVT